MKQYCLSSQISITGDTTGIVGTYCNGVYSRNKNLEIQLHNIETWRDMHKQI